MAWFRLEASFRDHRKVRRLARRLGVDMVHARGLLCGLICRVSDESPDGSLDDWSHDDIADAADWGGDASEFISALRECGWVDDTDSGTELHGYLERAEGYLAAQRARRHREKKKTSPSTDSVTHASVTRNVRVHDAPPNYNVDGRTDGRTDGQDRQTDGHTSSVSQSEPAGSDDVRQVFAHYREHHPRAHRKPNPKSKEWRAIKARLAEGYTVEDLCRAIDGCHASAFHQGQNDQGKRYDTLELIVRSGSKVQQFLEVLTRPPPKPQLTGWMKATAEFAAEDDDDRRIYDSDEGLLRPDDGRPQGRLSKLQSG